MEVQTVSLEKYSSLRVGGVGKLVEIATAEELIQAVSFATEEKLTAHILGEGTNS